MSEISSPQIGTREYYNTRVMPPNARKQELLKSLEEKVWRQVAMQLPENGRPTEIEFSDQKLLRDKFGWLELDWDKDPDIYKNIRNNVFSHEMEQIQCSIGEIPVYKFLLELRDSISYMKGYLDRGGWDKNTREMGKEWAYNFVNRWIEAFENRQYLPAEDNYDDSGREENWTLQKQFELLTKMSDLSDEQKIELIKAICLQLPTYPSAEFYWEDMQGLYDDIVASEK